MTFNTVTVHDILFNYLNQNMGELSSSIMSRRCGGIIEGIVSSSFVVMITNIPVV